MGKAQIRRSTKTIVLLAALVATLLPLRSTVQPVPFIGGQHRAPVNIRCIARNAVGVFYATQTGNTETVASKIGEVVGLEASDYDGEDFAELDGVIAGCPTWNTGADEYRSGTTWDDYLDSIKEYDLKGKVVAVFGCGDSQSYADNFCDGIEELHDAFEAAGAKMIGYVDASGYTFGESKSVKGGKFLGLPLDEDNEDDQTDGRISAWVEQLKSEGMPF